MRDIKGMLTILTSTVLIGKSKRAIFNGSCVGDVQFCRVGNQNTLAEERNVCVEVVVRKVHQIISGGVLVEIGRTLSSAREGTISRREGSLPHVGELVENVGIFGLVCVVIHEDDNALLRKDQFGQSRPLVETHRNVWWLVKVIRQVGLLKNLTVVTWLNKIAVDNEERHDIVWVIANPVANCVELAEVSPSVQ